MTTTTIRTKLMTYLADADDSKVKALYTLLAHEIEHEVDFVLTEEQLEILDKERELHLSGESKSYSRVEVVQIIRNPKL